MVNARLITKYVQDNFNDVGLNKRRQVTRLLYEVAKRERKDFKDVLTQARSKSGHINGIRDYLIRRRFPNVSRDEQRRLHFTELNVEPENRVRIKRSLDLSPKHFLIESAVADSPFVKRLHEKFPQATFEIISSYRRYHGKIRYRIADYNDRLSRFFIIKEDFDFYKRCACSHKSVYCGLHIVNLGSGCGFDCAYCYLQDYINSPGIILPANLEDFFMHFEGYKHDARFGSGEITDSLIFDHITEYSPKIVDFFKRYPKSSFEFKTKSDNIANLLSVKPGDNIIVSWSMNPYRIIKETEHYTAGLEQRLAAAEKCVAAGYKVAFHFDPMIHYEGWEDDYRTLVEKIFERVDKKRLAFMSLGTLRMTPRLKKVIENRFPESAFLDEEFLQGHDHKLRYRFEIRTKMYKHMKKWIRERDKDVYMYLCMEEKDACSSCATGPAKNE